MSESEIPPKLHVSKTVETINSTSGTVGHIPVAHMPNDLLRPFSNSSVLEKLGTSWRNQHVEIRIRSKVILDSDRQMTDRYTDGRIDR